MGEMIGYARVSTTDQKLDVQLDQLNALGVQRIFQEKASGADADRVELAAMISYVRDGDTVVCCKLDRMARSTSHLLSIVDTLKAKGVALKILNIDLDTNTATGKMMLTMLSSISEFEREIMLERQLEGINKAKEAGKYLGRKPTARAKSTEVLELLGQGRTKEAVAAHVGIGVASVYRIAKEFRASALANKKG